jgi:hypothetical protein
MNDNYMMDSSLHKLREGALEQAIRFYYQNMGMPFGPEVDEDHLAEHGSITNFSDGRMQFEIGEDLLVSFGPIEYSVQWEYGGVIMLLRQEIECHWKLLL